MKPDVFTHDPATNTYAAWIKELPGAISQGDTIEEARQNLQEAAQLIIETHRDDARRTIAENEAAGATVTEEVVQISC